MRNAALATLLLAGLPCAATLAPREARAEFLDNVTEHRLPNGLEVILVENHRAPVLTFQIWYRVGSRNELPGRTGLSHLLEHMMFKGTKKVGPEQFSQIVQENGGNDNAFTSSDYTAYFENIVSDRASVVIELESDRLANLRLRESDFDPERKVVMEERRMRTDDEPNSVLFEETEAVAFIGHPYGYPTIGWMSDLEQLTLDDLKTYHKAFYRPNDAVIVAAGYFEPEAILATIRKHFGPIPRGPDPPEMRSRLAPQNGERRVTVRRPAEIPYLAMGYRTPNHAGDDSLALEVLSVLLASGKSSRLYRSLVHDKRIALDVGTDYDRISHDPSLFWIVAQIQPDRPAAEVERAVEEEIGKLGKEEVSEAELAKAKNQIEAHFVYEQDSLFYQAMTIAEWEIAGGGWRAIRDYLPGIRKVTAAEVRAACAKYLVPESRTVGVLVPLPTQRKEGSEGEQGPAGRPAPTGGGGVR